MRGSGSGNESGVHLAEWVQVHMHTHRAPATIGDQKIYSTGYDHAEKQAIMEPSRTRCMYDSDCWTIYHCRLVEVLISHQ